MPSNCRRRDGGTTAGTHTARFGFARFGHGACAGVRAQIVVGQFQTGAAGRFRGRGELVRAQGGALLDADTVRQEQLLRRMTKSCSVNPNERSVSIRSAISSASAAESLSPIMSALNWKCLRRAPLCL